MRYIQQVSKAAVSQTMWLLRCTSTHPKRHMIPCMHAGTRFAFNAYHIGKERCYFQVALRLGLRVWVSARRYRTLLRLDLPKEWLRLITKDKHAAEVIVSDPGVGPPQLQALQKELGKPVIGFQCTGAFLHWHAFEMISSEQSPCPQESMFRLIYVIWTVYMSHVLQVGDLPSLASRNVCKTAQCPTVFHTVSTHPG
jgi:hypothetical protein